MTIYQVLPRLWGNGKFSDWQQPSFDYLKSLGVDAIWYTGVIRHSAGAPYVKGNAGSPYSIADYRDVNPYLADSARSRRSEFRSLVRRTREAGFLVFIDFIPNHVGPSCRDVPTHPYCDYDWTDTLKIDYSSPLAREAMLDIALYWAGLGVDGFRCDMVELVPPDIMGWLIAGVKEKYPHFIFIGEAYEKHNYHRYINEVGFDLLYDKSGFYDIVRGIICGQRSARELSGNWQWLGGLQSRMLNFLENHDEQRLASPFFAGDPARGYAALAFGALFNDASYMLYSGQELGEDASEGAEGRTSIFDFVKVRTLQHLWLRLRTGKGLTRAESRVLKRYREILGFARTFRGMSNWDLCYCNLHSPGFNPDRHFAFVRYDGTRAWLVFCNFSSEAASACISLPDELKEKCHPASRQNGTLPVAAGAWDAVILTLPR